MENQQPVRKIVLKSKGALTAADIASDHKYLYILDKRSPKVLRFALDGEEAGEFTTTRKYTRFCYDAKAHCFWAVCGGGQVIYRLNPSFVEESKFSSGLQDVASIESLKLLPAKHSILTTTGTDIYEVYPLGFSHHLLRSTLPLMLYDQITACRVMVRENKGCEILLCNKFLTEYKRIEVPDGYRYVGETFLQNDSPELLILFGKYGGEFIVNAYSDATVEESSFFVEELLPLIGMMNFTDAKPKKEKKKPKEKEPDASKAQPTEAAENPAPKTEDSTQKQPADPESSTENPWSFVGDILKLSDILNEPNDGK